MQKLTIGSHAGTHIDAPSHFIANGKTIDDVPLDHLVGPAIVVDLTETGRGSRLRKRQVIGWTEISTREHDIRRYISLGERPIVLLRTGWSEYWTKDDYADHPYLSAEAAQRIIDLGVRVIGIDTFSPDETFVDFENVPEPSFEVHKIVLGAGAIIAENLTNLEAIQEGEWIVSLVPLKIGGCDGSPVRACAWRKGQF